MQSLCLLRRGSGDGLFPCTKKRPNSARSLPIVDHYGTRLREALQCLAVKESVFIHTMVVFLRAQYQNTESTTKILKLTDRLRGVVITTKSAINKA